MTTLAKWMTVCHTRVGTKDEARVVRAVAGCAGGWQRRQRRGSILVVVLGTLALLAVLTLVYVSQGQSDRRTAAVTIQKNRVEDTASRVGAYIGDIIARDALATFVDPAFPAGVPTKSGTGGNEPILKREAFDAPVTDPYRRSDIVTSTYGGDPTMRFDPAGDYTNIWAVANDPPPDPRLPSDPWLAASEPTWIIEPNAAPNVPLEARHLYAVDWAQISNIAPDGRYVNLANLRNNFDARPGQAPGQMSHGLWLYSQQRIAPTGGTNGAPPNNYTVDLPFSNNPANLNIPAHWTMYQKFAFRPMTDPAYGPGSWQYLPYTWADADGDGMADSRWVELLDAADPDNVIPILPGGDGFRWFVAARIVDLSGRVNVNTASEFRQSPNYSQNLPTPGPLGEVYPAGLYPGEIDLRRLLTFVDVYKDENAKVAGGDGVAAIENLPRPVPANNADDYSIADETIMQTLGRHAYNALRYAKRAGEPPARNVDLDDEGQSNTNVGDLFVPLNARGRADESRLVGAHSGGASYSELPSSQVVLETAGYADLADLLELLTYNGINNPDNLSRLEQILGGRFSQQVTDVENRLSPLRDNRGLDLERKTAQISNGPEVGQIDIGAPEGRASLVRQAVDVRQQLTTISGARPISGVGTLSLPVLNSTSESVWDAISTLAPGEARVDAVGAIEDAMAGSPHGLFSAYARALLPYASRPETWAEPMVGNQFATLSYGYDPRFALRVAAHMTANMKDLYDNDPSPTAGLGDMRMPSVMTLKLRTANTWLPSPSTYPGWSDGGRLDLDASLTAAEKAAGLTNLPQDSTGLNAINIYGIEPQAFITEVMSVYVYTDAPFGIPGADNDGQSKGGDPPTYDPITIDGAIDLANPDFLLQAVAFQVHNPFDVPVGLTQAGNTTVNATVTLQPNEPTDHYIELGGRRYNLGADIGSPTTMQNIVLQPGETRVLYALCASEAALQSQWTTISAGSSMTQFLKNQFSSGAVNVNNSAASDPVRLPIPVPLPGKSGMDLFGGASTAELKAAKLMRVYLAKAPFAETKVANNPANDLMLDRLQVPPTSAGILDRKPPSPDTDITDTNATGDVDNTGFTIALFGGFRRHSWNSATPLPKGAFPAWCVEGNPTRGTFLNIKVDDDTDPSALDLGDFSTGAKTGRETFLDFTSDFAPVVPTDLTPQTSIDGILNLGVRADPQDKHKVVQSTEHMPSNKSVPAKPYAELFAELARNDRRFESSTLATPPASSIKTLRVADMLLPLGVGPEHNPIPGPGGDDDQEWITLGESMALALDYSDTISATTPWWIVHQNAGKSSATVTPKLDRGHLVLDRYAPFVDVDNDRRFTFDLDHRAGLGTPLALGVLDVFQTIDPQFASLTKMTPGLININTAPLNVLRTIPMLTPTQGVGEWWGTGAGLPSPTLGPTHADLAATIVGYRSKIAIADRTNQATGLVRFDDDDADLLFDPPQQNGRFLTSHVEAQREQPGFASLGETMMMIERNATKQPTTPTRIASRVNQADGWALDNSNSGAPGVTTALYPAANNQPRSQINGITNDYAEKVMTLSALGNTASVRSDVFAVYFVLHGYQRSDCENLSNSRGDPLVPSVARRYLMVIDRSNVVRRGDKPKVVLFTEVPLS